MPKTTFHHLPSDKKNHILDAARRVYMKAPFKDLTISMVVKEAGIARGSFYQYFDSLEDLYRSIFEESLARFEAHALKTIETYHTTDIFEFFLKSFHHDYDYMKDTGGHEVLHKFFKERSQFGVASDFFQHRHNESYRRVLDKLGNGGIAHLEGYNQVRVYRVLNHLKFQLLQKVLRQEAPFEQAYDDFKFYLTLIKKGSIAY